jgi:hypothetical protein
MRIAIALAVLAGVFLIAPKPASSAPLALGDQARLSQQVTGALAETARYKTAQARHYKRYAANTPRRYNWAYYPYWRPYQYHYWQFYYPYGGPLF